MTHVIHSKGEHVGARRGAYEQQIASYSGKTRGGPGANRANGELLRWMVSSSDRQRRSEVQPSCRRRSQKNLTLKRFPPQRERPREPLTHLANTGRELELFILVPFPRESSPTPCPEPRSPTAEPRSHRRFRSCCQRAQAVVGELLMTPVRERRGAIYKMYIGRAR